jgi:hypothetical protein
LAETLLTPLKPTVITKRILGIDPGLRRTGFGIIDVRGQSLVYVTSGIVRVPVGELPERLKAILDCLGQVIVAHAPVQAAIEKVFVNVNPQSTLLLGQARGAAICAAVACAAREGRSAGLDWLLEFCDSSITYRSRYMGQPEWLPALDLV